MLFRNTNFPKPESIIYILTKRLISGFRSYLLKSSLCLKRIFRGSPSSNDAQVRAPHPDAIMSRKRYFLIVTRPYVSTGDDGNTLVMLLTVKLAPWQESVKKSHRYRQYFSKKGSKVFLPPIFFSGSEFISILPLFSSYYGITTFNPDAFPSHVCDPFKMPTRVPRFFGTCKWMIRVFSVKFHFFFFFIRISLSVFSNTLKTWCTSLYGYEPRFLRLYQRWIWQKPRDTLSLWIAQTMHFTEGLTNVPTLN